MRICLLNCLLIAKKPSFKFLDGDTENRFGLLRTIIQEISKLSFECCAVRPVIKINQHNDNNIIAAFAAIGPKLRGQVVQQSWIVFIGFIFGLIRHPANSPMLMNLPRVRLAILAKDFTHQNRKGCQLSLPFDKNFKVHDLSRIQIIAVPQRSKRLPFIDHVLHELNFVNSFHRRKSIIPFFKNPYLVWLQRIYKIGLMGGDENL